MVNGKVKWSEYCTSHWRFTLHGYFRSVKYWSYGQMILHNVCTYLWFETKYEGWKHLRHNGTEEFEIYNEIDQIGAIIISEMGERESEVSGVDVQHIQNKTPPECVCVALGWWSREVKAVECCEMTRMKVQIYPQVSITGQRGEHDHNW